MLPCVCGVPLFSLATLFLCRQDFAGEPLQEYTHLSGRLQISVCLCGLNSLAVYGRGFRTKTGLAHGLPQFTISCRIVSLGSDCRAQRRDGPLRLTKLQVLHTPRAAVCAAVTFFQTGFQLAGRPSIGGWIAYGLGSESQDLPGFVVMVSQGEGPSQALADRQWGSGFLPTKYQGVKFRSGSDPLLYLSDPPGYSSVARRRFLDDLTRLNHLQFEQYQDPEIATRIAQYEMAFRMQSSVPELADLSKEPDSTFDLYGPDSRKPGTYAANCILARRLAERGVRFIQLFHRGWDRHSNLPKQIRGQCLQTDQPSAALIQDLKQRGMLKDTLVIWGGEFGRTVYSQGALTDENYGRDHHPRCFSVWMAGGGIQGGLSYGETDDFSYNIVKDPVDVHDLHATILHCLGIDHTQLTFKFQGRHYRLTDVHGNVVNKILS